MIDETWKLFCQTGNIETYLLLKELEDYPHEKSIIQTTMNETVTLDNEI